MFLVSHTHDQRANEIRSWIRKNASAALIIAAVYFEWAVCRAIIGLSKRPNQDVRADLVRTHGLDEYKKLWRRETAHLQQSKLLPAVVTRWHDLHVAFDARHRLVHGRDRYTPNMATPKIEAILAAVGDVHQYCTEHGRDLNRRLPQRRKKRAK